MRKYDHLIKRLAEIENSLPDLEYERRWQAVIDALYSEEEDDGSGVAWKLSEAMNRFSEYVEKYG